MDAGSVDMKCPLVASIYGAYVAKRNGDSQRYKRICVCFCYGRGL